MKINKEILEQMVNEGWVSKRKHPTFPLYIYNYTPECQFEKKWNDTTLICRGLVLDEEYNIIAKPFNKFFNIEEIDKSEIPNLPFEVYDKVDGSLGIIFFYNNTWNLTTRGSFTSDQAIKGMEILHTKYKHILNRMDINNTYLVEIIYKENRIVINYGDFEGLVLIGIIKTSTGEDLPLTNFGFPVVHKYYFDDYSTIKKLEWKDKEGFVVKFSNGFRLKIKFENYKLLHRLITNTSNITIWEMLSMGKSLEIILNNIPDEFYNWIIDTQRDLKDKYFEIESYVENNFKVLSNRKETAEYFKTLKYSSLFFKKLDDKNYSDLIWKIIKPKTVLLGHPSID